MIIALCKAKYISLFYSSSFVKSTSGFAVIFSKAFQKEARLKQLHLKVYSFQALEANKNDDDDLDLFGEETEEEKKPVEEREATKKASTKKKESGKSLVLLEVKPWDDETDMKKLEEVVRSVQMSGLLWGASKFAAIGYGIKKLQIMMTIEDDLVCVDNIIEDYLTAEPPNKYIQGCDIVAFNKI